MKRNKVNQLPLITYIILAINLGVYAYMLLRFQTTTSVEALLSTGAKSNELIVLNNEWWRLITPAFIHIGFEHLLFNNLSIYYIGQDLEKILGHWRFLWVFLLASLGGNLFSFAFNENISAGASTGIFGLFVAYIALSIMYPRFQDLKQRALNFSILIILNIGTSLFSSGIDNWGHFGGAVFGALATLSVGLPIRVKSQISNSKRLLAGVFMLVIMAALVYFRYKQYF